MGLMPISNMSVKSLLNPQPMSITYMKKLVHGQEC
jgi:hypothetical protein